MNKLNETPETIQPTITQSKEAQEAINRRIMAGISVIEDDGWKYARQDKALQNSLNKR